MMDTTNTELTVIVGDGYTQIKPIVPEEIKKTLTYWHKTLVRDMSVGQMVSKGESKRLYGISQIIDPVTSKLVDSIIFPFGLTATVMNKLGSLGYTYKIIDQRTPFPLPHPENCNYADGIPVLRDFQIEGFFAVLDSGGGIMCCPTGWGKTHIMAALLKVHRYEDLLKRGTPNCIVTVPDIDNLKKTYTKFKKILPERQIGCLGGGMNKFSDDITLITMGSLHRLNPNTVGIILIDEVHTIATEKRSQCVLAMSKAKKWGFSATPTGRFDNADLLTTGVVGPIVYTRTYSQGVKDKALVPITVYWVTAPQPKIGVDKLHNFKSKSGQVRHGILRNPNLNKTIIDILHNVPDDMQTLCMVQQIEQINYLMSIDNTIEYVHGTSDQSYMTEQRYTNVLAVSEDRRDSMYKKMESGEQMKLISTGIYKQGVDFPNLTILINAGGGGSEIMAGQIPGRASRSTADKDQSYIIDFWYPWDTVIDGSRVKPGILQRDARERNNVYAELGFERIFIDSILDIPFLKKDGLETTRSSFDTAANCV